MPTLKKGSAAAKAFMAKLRAARGKNKPKAKKVGAKKTATKKVIAKKVGATKKVGVLNEYAKQFIREESQDSGQGYTYRAKILRGEPILLKELKNQPIKKFYFDFNEAVEIAKKLNKVPISKKVGATKKIMPTKKASSMHKDTKSHNVNIRVVSGTDSIDNHLKRLKLDDNLESLKDRLIFNNDINIFLKDLKIQLKNYSLTTEQKNAIKKHIIVANKQIIDNKKMIVIIKRMI